MRPEKFENHGQLGVESQENVSHMILFDESRLTLRLALPLMIGQLSQMLLGVADAVMIGRLGVPELAALTFANSLFHVPFVFGIGVLTAVSVFTSNARGANDAASSRESCRHGLFLATGLGLCLFGFAWFLSMHLRVFGQPSEISARTTDYFRILMASVVPALASIALKNHADALQRPWPPFWIFLGGVGMNIGLNWVMIYGHLGCPKLGFEGAAWATLIARTGILAAMLIWLLHAKGLHDWIPRHWFLPPVWKEMKRLLSIGISTSIQMLFEVSAFSLAGLLMGRFGPDAMAGHQIAITIASTAFMIPLGLSMALSVRIGEANGAGDWARLRPIAISGWLLVTISALSAAAGLFIFGKRIAECFIGVSEVVDLAASMLVIVSVFQLVDGLQVTSSAMLRGLRDAKVPAVIGLLSYWAVGLPVGAVLAFGFQMGARGVWWGLATGLCVASLALGPRLWRHTGQMAREAVNPMID
jgi:MATE family multidrug resistance protein